MSLKWKAISEIVFMICYPLRHPLLRDLEFPVFGTNSSLSGLCIFAFKAPLLKYILVALLVAVVLKLRQMHLSICNIIILNRPLICFSVHSICYPGTSGKMILFSIQIR